MSTAMELNRYQQIDVDEMVASISPKYRFLTEMFFSTGKDFTGNSIEHDIVEGGHMVAPFVSPLSQGKSTRRPGYYTVQTRTAYVKFRDTVTPEEGMTRLANERFAGDMTPMQRLDRLVAEKLVQYDQMLENRIEVMAAELLWTGKITIEMDDYPTTTVDFNRNPNNDATLATLWSAGGATPLADIEDFARVINKTGRGVKVSKLIMRSDIYRRLTKFQEVRDLQHRDYNLSRSSVPLELGPQNHADVAYRGRLGEFDIWTYDAYFENDLGVDVDIVSADKVLFVADQGPNSGLEGRRYQSSIHDLDAKMEPRRLFVKTKPKWDPSGYDMVAHSAPMLAVRRPNGVGTLKVL